eukprot:6205735-Pleurochrysis_carterae.AAC.1
MNASKVDGVVVSVDESATAPAKRAEAARCGGDDGGAAGCSAMAPAPAALRQAEAEEAFARATARAQSSRQAFEDAAKEDFASSSEDIEQPLRKCGLHAPLELPDTEIGLALCQRALTEVDADSDEQRDVARLLKDSRHVFRERAHLLLNRRVSVELDGARRDPAGLAQGRSAEAQLLANLDEQLSVLRRQLQASFEDDQGSDGVGIGSAAGIGNGGSANINGTPLNDGRVSLETSQRLILESLLHAQLARERHGWPLQAWAAELRS